MQNELSVDLPTIPPSQQPVLQTVLRLAQTCEFEVNHSLHVTRLAISLFEQLAPLHHLGEKERTWLIYAGLLHDIGWIEGGKEHHKVSLRIILTTPMLPFSNKERLVIGSIARYHNKSLPNKKHDHYQALEPHEQRITCILAGILRLADGLDYTHSQRVEKVRCQIGAKKITLTCHVSVEAPEEYQAALQKGDLLEKTFERKLVLEGLV